MSLKTIKINFIKITFDKEKTKEHRTAMNNPCDCQDCRNYYKHIDNNSELVEFLNGFSIDYNCTDEVFSWKSNGISSAFGLYGVIQIIICKVLNFNHINF